MWAIVAVLALHVIASSDGQWATSRGDAQNTGHVRELFFYFLRHNLSCALLPECSSIQVKAKVLYSSLTLRLSGRQQPAAFLESQDQSGTGPADDF